MTGQAIPFTQYLRPDGRQVPVHVDRPAKVFKQAMAFFKKGGRFEIEVLMTGEVSMTAEIFDEDGKNKVLGHEIVPNGPEVLQAVDRLVETTK